MNADHHGEVSRAFVARRAEVSVGGFVVGHGGGESTIGGRRTTAESFSLEETRDVKWASRSGPPQVGPRKPIWKMRERERSTGTTQRTGNRDDVDAREGWKIS
jgi:hypothetical protein